MEHFLFIIILGALSGLSEGAGALDDTSNGCIAGTVMFETNLNPPENPFQSVSWRLGADVPIITSLLDRNITTQEYEGRIALHRSTGSLELRNLNLSDTGEYRVTILSATGFQTTGSTRLDLYANVSVTVTPPTADLVEFNSSVRLSCSSSGPSPSFIWMNRDSEVTVSDRIQIDNTDRGSTLTIVNVTRYEVGSYKCRPLCPDTSDLPEAKLSVSFGPENIQLLMSPSEQPSLEGSTITLKCSTNSEPPAEFFWFLNGNKLPDTGSEIRLENLQRNQTGSYSCQAFNTKTLRYLTSSPSDIWIQEPTGPGLSAGAIAGIVIACLVVVAAVVGGVYYWCRQN